MSCITIPKLPLPTLPPGITIPGIGIDLGITFAVDLCCKIPPVKIPLPPVGISPTILNPGVIATLNAAIQSLQSYLHSIPLKCPLE